MKLPTIVNVSQFTPPDELDIIRGEGFSVLEYSPPTDPSPVSVNACGDSAKQFCLLRSTRLENQNYADLYATLDKQGLRLRNNPETSAILSEFSLHYHFIKDISPRAMVFPFGASAEGVFNELLKNNFSKHIFMKTERKSLKVESMVREASIDSIDRCMKSLVAAFAPFKTFVVKEVVPLEPVDHRAIVFGTDIIGFDTGPHAGDVNHVQSPVFEFVYETVGMLLRKGLNGDYVIDVARRTDTNRFVVVEIKDLQFTQIKHPRHIWKEIARKCKMQ